MVKNIGEFIEKMEGVMDDNRYVNMSDLEGIGVNYYLIPTVARLKPWGPTTELLVYLNEHFYSVEVFIEAFSECEGNGAGIHIPEELVLNESICKVEPKILVKDIENKAKEIGEGIMVFRNKVLHGKQGTN